MARSHFNKDSREDSPSLSKYPKFYLEILSLELLLMIYRYLDESERKNVAKAIVTLAGIEDHRIFDGVTEMRFPIDIDSSLLIIQNKIHDRFNEVKYDCLIDLEKNGKRTNTGEHEHSIEKKEYDLIYAAMKKGISLIDAAMKKGILEGAARNQGIYKLRKTISDIIDQPSRQKYGKYLHDMTYLLNALDRPMSGTIKVKTGLLPQQNDPSQPNEKSRQPRPKLVRKFTKSFLNFFKENPVNEEPKENPVIEESKAKPVIEESKTSKNPKKPISEKSKSMPLLKR